MESMITMGGYSLPSKTIREMIASSVDVIVQAARLRDGSRRITHITEVLGLEGDVIITQDLFVYDMMGEDAQGNILGKHRSTGVGRPRFWDRARYFGEEKRLAAALDAAEQVRPVERAREWSMLAPETLPLGHISADCSQRRRGRSVPLFHLASSGESERPRSGLRPSPRLQVSADRRAPFR